MNTKSVVREYLQSLGSPFPAKEIARVYSIRTRKIRNEDILGEITIDLLKLISFIKERHSDFSETECLKYFSFSLKSIILKHLKKLDAKKTNPNLQPPPSCEVSDLYAPSSNLTPIEEEPTVSEKSNEEIYLEREDSSALSQSLISLTESYTPLQRLLFSILCLDRGRCASLCDFENSPAKQNQDVLKMRKKILEDLEKCRKLSRR